MAVGVGYEVEVVGLGGVDGGAQGRRGRGWRTGPGGQAEVAVGVVGRGVGEVGGVDGATPAVFEERVTLIEPVGSVARGCLWRGGWRRLRLREALGVLARFFFDQ